MYNKESLLSKEDEIKLVDILSINNTIFQTFWEIGTPVLTKEILTAAVGFDKNGSVLYMIINPEFWSSLNLNNKAFLISHECLHVILNHGARTRNIKNKKLANIAQDIVINEMLINGFGFNQYEISNWDKLCFVKTIFDADEIKQKNIKTNGSFNYYLDLLEQEPRDHLDQETLDHHDDGEPTSGEIGKLIESARQNSKEVSQEILEEAEVKLSPEEKEDLEEILSEEVKDAKDTRAGSISLGLTQSIAIKNEKESKKWEKLVKDKMRSIVKSKNKGNASWITKGRRHACLSDELMAQGDWDTKSKMTDKINLVFFLDSSGSCHRHSSNFVKLLRTIPKKTFEIDAYSFDTKIYPIDIKTDELKGYGGTLFSILDKKIVQITKESRHPDAIFILSDGCGDSISPQKPKLWHWILTERYSDKHLPKDSPRHKIKDFK